MTDTIPELDSFQVRTLAFMDKADGRLVLADPMGARKTGTTLSWLWMRSVPRTLVVAPTAVHGHWTREARDFYPEAEVFVGRGPKRTEQLAAAAAREPSIYITTYESMKLDEALIKAAKFTAVVFDEGHRLKGRRTGVALTANAVTSKAKHIICATGTPVINHAAELWQYLHMLAPKTYRSFWTWAETHFVVTIQHTKVKTRWPVKVVGDYKPGHEAIVRAQIKPFFIQRALADLFPGQAWIEEPEHVAIEVELSPSERKLYKNLVKYQWGDTPTGTITTSNKLALTTRLTQLASDWGTLDAEHENGTKVKATVDLVLDLLERDEPVVVFTLYHLTAERIYAALAKHKVKARVYHGGIPPEGREGAVRDFADGKCQVLIGTLQSLGEGVDGAQKRCNTVVLADHFWTAAKNDQAVGRIKRSGQQRRVTVYHVFAEGTIDTTIADACLRKVNVIESLNERPLVDSIYGRVAP
jgi:SNF2 family DNA or RNA helicase